MTLDSILRKAALAVGICASLACGKEPTRPDRIFTTVPVWQELETRSIMEHAPEGTLIYPNLKAKARYGGPIAYRTAPNAHFQTYFDGSDLRLFRLEDDYAGVDTIRVYANEADAAFTVVINPVDDPAVWLPLTDREIGENAADNTAVYRDIASRLHDDGPKRIEVISNNSAFTAYYDAPDIRIRDLSPGWTGRDSVIVEGNGKRAGFLLRVTHGNRPASCTLERTLSVGDGYDIFEVFMNDQVIASIDLDLGNPYKNTWHSWNARTGELLSTGSYAVETSVMGIVGTSGRMYDFHRNDYGDGALNLWNTSTGERKGQAVSVSGDAVAMNSRYVFLPDHDEMRVFDVNSQTLLGPFQIPQLECEEDAFATEDYIILPTFVDSFSAISVLDAGSFTPVFSDSISGYRPTHACVYASPHHALLRSIYKTKLYDASFRLLRADSWPAGITSCALGDDFFYLKTAGVGALYDTETFERKFIIPLEIGEEETMGFFGNRFYCASGDKIYVYRLED